MLWLCYSGRHVVEILISMQYVEDLHVTTIVVWTGLYRWYQSNCLDP